ncbi:hypothetical protein MIDIC_110061 [Alphaproteobacteria bacterium]
MLKFLPSTPQKYRIFQSEYKAGGFLPYVAHWNKNAILTNRNELMQVIKIGGFSFETADDEDLDIKKNIRNSLFKGMGSNNLGLYFHIIRRKQRPYPDNYVNTDIPSGFAAFLDSKWVGKYKNKEAFVNELYITLICQLSSTSGFLDKVMSKLNIFWP